MISPFDESAKSKCHPELHHDVTVNVMQTIQRTDSGYRLAGRNGTQLIDYGALLACLW